MVRPSPIPLRWKLSYGVGQVGIAVSGFGRHASRCWCRRWSRSTSSTRSRAARPNVTIASMTGDVADENETTPGNPPGRDSTPGEVPGSVLFDFGAVYCSFSILMLLSMWIFYPYALSRRRHEEIRAAFSSRRQTC